jgi:hypothetical protein
MDNNDFDPSVFSRIGCLIYTQDKEDCAKQLLLLQQTKNKLHNLIENNKFGIELLCKLLEFVEKEESHTSWESETDDTD